MKGIFLAVPVYHWPKTACHSLSCIVMQRVKIYQARFSGLRAGKVPETAKIRQKRSEAVLAVRTRDVMFNCF